MKKPHGRLVCAAMIALLAFVPARAMQVHSRSLAEVVGMSPVAVVAEVTATAPPDESPTTRALSFRSRVVGAVFGDKPAMAELRCRYEEGRPHQRGAVAVSPLVTGSGKEFGLRPGDRVVLLLERSPAEADDCRVLRVEPAASKARIARLKRAAATSR